MSWGRPTGSIGHPVSVLQVGPATLGSRIRGNHLGSDIYGSTFRLTLASALRTSLALEPIGGGQRVTRPAASGGRIVDTVPQEDF